MSAYRSDHPATECGVSRSAMLMDEARRLAGAGDFDQALQLVRSRISEDPLNEWLFELLGDLYEQGGKIGESVVALQRAMQLKELSARYEVAPGAWHLKDLQAHARSPEHSLTLDGIIFPRLELRQRTDRTCLVGRSLSGEEFLLVEFAADEARLSRMENELAVLRHLTDRNCLSAPRLFGAGAVGREQVCVLLDDQSAALVRQCSGGLRYRITSFLRRDPTPFFGDIALSLLEQRSHGVYIGRLLEDSPRLDASAGICSLIGYGRAIFLDESTRALRGRAFFEWCREHELGHLETEGATPKTFLFGTRAQALDQSGFAGCLMQDRLDLGSTHTFSKQMTTGQQVGSYHGMMEEELFIQGQRGVGEPRTAILEAAFGEPGESVLDLGCAGGVLSQFLARKGCRVTAVDIDPQLMRGCRMTSTILGLDIDYQRINLDYEDVDGSFDTVCLFSVLECFVDREVVAAKVANMALRRILIEANIKEDGYRYFNGGFQRLPGWEFGSLAELSAYLEALLPGFAFARDLGESDGGAHILEFVRKPEAGESL